MTFAARDFSPRRGVSDEHIPQWICKERATKSGRKRPAALRVAPNLACGFVARRLQPHGRGCALLAPRHRPNWAQRTSSYLCLRPLSARASAEICKASGLEIRPSFRQQSHQWPRLLLIRRTCAHSRARHRRSSEQFLDARLKQLEFCGEIVSRFPALVDAPRPKGPVGSQSHRGAPNAPEFHPIRALSHLPPLVRWCHGPRAKGI